MVESLWSQTGQKDEWASCYGNNCRVIEKMVLILNSHEYGMECLKFQKRDNSYDIMRRLATTLTLSGRTRRRCGI